MIKMIFGLETSNTGEELAKQIHEPKKIIFDKDGKILVIFQFKF